MKKKSTIGKCCIKSQCLAEQKVEQLRNILSDLSSQTQDESKGYDVSDHDAQLLYQDITAMNVLSTTDYPAAELISGIVSVQSEFEVLRALNDSFTEDIDISTSTMANNELQDLYDQMHIDSSGSPDHDECQDEPVN